MASFSKKAVSQIIPNIFRVSLAITHPLHHTTVCYNPKQEWPMHPLLSHPCKAAPRGTAWNTATCCKNHSEYQGTPRKISSQTIPDEKKKKAKKRRRGLDKLRGAGAGFLMPITALESIPVPLLILQISAAVLGMSYSHDWELVKGLKINPCRRVLITLKICPQSFIWRKSEQATMWWEGNDRSGLHCCFLRLCDQPCPEYSNTHQDSIQQSFWEHFTLTRHLNLILVSVGHR